MKANFEIPIEHVRAALIVAAKSDVRYYLNGVCFSLDPEKGRVLTIATDGHRLLVLRATSALAECEAGEFIVPRDALEDAAKGVKAGTAINVSLDEDGRVGLTTLKRQLTTRRVDARFPEWQRVMPYNPSGEPAQYDPAYIADFGRVASLFGKSGWIDVGYNGLSPALVTFGTTPDAIAALMPLRMGENDNAVEWLLGELKAERRPIRTLGERALETLGVLCEDWSKVPEGVQVPEAINVNAHWEAAQRIVKEAKGAAK